MQSITQRTMHPILQIQIITPLHHMRKQIPIKRGILRKQRLKVKRLLRRNQRIKTHLLRRHITPISMRQMMLRIRARRTNLLENHIYILKCRSPRPKSHAHNTRHNATLTSSTP